jgi:tetratricopeptide (TPR) repeat protein
MPHRRVAANSGPAREALEAGLRAEHGDDLQQALNHYADAAISAGDDPAIVAQALTRQAGVYRRLSEWERAANYARRASEIAHGAGLPSLIAEALVAEANALMCSGRLDEAASAYHRLVRVATDDRQRGIAMQNIGSIHAQKREFVWAAEAFSLSRELFRSAGYARGEAIATNNLGRLAFDLGELAEADQVLEEALWKARDVEDAELCALVRLNLAQVRVAQGKYEPAGRMVAEAYGHFAVSENRWRQIECLCVLADIAEAEGQKEQARVHLERGREVARAIGARVELERIEERLGGSSG